MLKLENIKNLKNKNLGFFRFKKFDEKTFLITNDLGNYSFLTSDEFNNFISGNLKSGDKYNELLSKNFIKSQTYEIDLANKYANKNHFLGHGPSLHLVIATLRCNHRCLYCHASAGSEKSLSKDMSLETAKKVLDTIFYTSALGLTIEFQGGEPLLNWEVIKFVVEQGKIMAGHLAKTVQFAIVTNLTLMTDEIMDYIIENDIHVSTSLDGDEILHNNNRVYKGGNSFEKVSYWIKKFNSEYEKRGIKNSFGAYQKVGALLTVTKKSLSQYKEIIDTYMSLGIDGVFLRMLNPYGFALEDSKNLSYSAEEFGKFYTNSMDYILELNKKGIKFREQLSLIYLAKILSNKDPNFLDIRSPCGACVGQLAYNYDGQVYSCDEGRMLASMGIYDFRAGTVGDDAKKTYEDIMNSELTKTMILASTVDALPGYNDSVYKPYIGICPLYNYKTQGNIYSNFSLDERHKVEVIILDYIFSKLKDPENKKIFENWLGYYTINVCN